MIRAFSIAALLALGCGEYVEYANEAPGTGPIARGSLDEETKEKLSKVDRFDHVLLDGVLATAIVEGQDGTYVYVDYARLAASDEALLLLDQYLATVDIVTAEQLADTGERLAYWINVYNASVIRGVLDAWDGDSSYSVSEEDFVFFQIPQWSAGGEIWSLDQIEHGIIRGDQGHDAYVSADATAQARMLELHENLWQGAPLDARIHVALNCAALSCPNLPSGTPFVYRPAVLEEQLDAASRSFCNNAIKGAGPDGISQLFSWFGQDFELRFGSATNFVATHRDGGLDGVNVDRFIEYDWSLNAAP